MQIEIVWDSGQLRVWQGRSVERAVGRALFKSGRDALRTLRTESSRTVRARKRIKLARVNKSLATFFPSSSDSIGDLEWRMDVSGKAIPLVDYPHSQTRAGVMVAVNVGKRVLIRSAFEAKMKSGHDGIFARRGKSRLPIDELFSTRISDVFRDAGMITSVVARALGAFDRTFDRVFPLELDKLT